MIHTLLNNFESSEHSTLQQEYTQTLRSSLNQLKQTTKAKLASVNVSVPEVWLVRDSLKERAVQYTRESTQSRERLKEWEREKEREKVQSKTRALMERIIKDRNQSARKMFIKQEQDKLKDAIEIAQMRASMFKGTLNVEDELSLS